MWRGGGGILAGMDFGCDRLTLGFDLQFWGRGAKWHFLYSAWWVVGGIGRGDRWMEFVRGWRSGAWRWVTDWSAIA